MPKKTKILLALLFLLIPVLVLANGNGDYIPLENPLQYDTIPELLAALTRFLIQVGLALVTFMIVLGGAFYMFGGINPDNVKKGKNIITWTVVGIMIALFAYAVLAVVQFVLS